MQNPLHEAAEKYSLFKIGNNYKAFMTGGEWQWNRCQSTMTKLIDHGRKMEISRNELKEKLETLMVAVEIEIKFGGCPELTEVLESVKEEEKEETKDLIH